MYLLCFCGMLLWTLMQQPANLTDSLVFCHYCEQQVTKNYLNVKAVVWEAGRHQSCCPEDWTAVEQSRGIHYSLVSLEKPSLKVRDAVRHCDAFCEYQIKDTRKKRKGWNEESNRPLGRTDKVVESSGDLVWIFKQCLQSKYLVHAAHTVFMFNRDRAGMGAI